MHLLYQRIERHLESSNLGALTLDDLVRRVQEDSVGPHVDMRTVTAEIARWPDRFRIVDPWEGRRKTAPARAGMVRESYGSVETTTCTKEAGPVWAVLVSAVLAEPARTPLRERPRQVAGLVRESVLHLAHALDGRSIRALARWTRIAGSGDETGGRLRPV